ALNVLLEKLMLANGYSEAYEISRSLLGDTVSDCRLGSIAVISGVRIGKMKDVKDIVSAIRGCKDNLSLVAKTVYENAILEEELKGE
ncbi:MAG: hypothetical protein ABGX27_04495, partial [Desulfurobacteriaceae bacterium]